MTGFKPNDGRKAVIPISGRDVDDARRLLSLLSNCWDIMDTKPALHIANSFGSYQTPSQQKVGELLRLRRKRNEVFGKAMFGEPAWEMLLLLYLTDSGPKQTVSRLADLTEASKSTAIRWLDYLVGQALVQREAHPTDKRAIFVELTDKGRDKIERYLSEIGGDSNLG